jgi:hypothetical protein
VGGGIDFAKQTNIYKEKKKKKLVAKGMFFSFLLILFALGIWGGAYSYKFTQEREVTNIKNKISQEKNQRDFDKVAEILDVATRLNFVNQFSQKQKFWSGFLGEIEGKTFPSIYFSSLEGESSYSLKNENSSSAPTAAAVSVNDKNKVGQIKIGMVSSSLNDISKQIIAFKKSDKIESAVVDKISLDDKGLVFLMTLNLSSDALERFTYEKTKEEELNPVSGDGVDISEPGSIEAESQNAGE